MITLILLYFISSSSYGSSCTTQYEFHSSHYADKAKKVTGLLDYSESQTFFRLEKELGEMNAQSFVEYTHKIRESIQTWNKAARHARLSFAAPIDWIMDHFTELHSYYAELDFIQYINSIRHASEENVFCMKVKSSRQTLLLHSNIPIYASHINWAKPEWGLEQVREYLNQRIPGDLELAKELKKEIKREGE